MTRPAIVFAFVTALLVGYGRYPWSWVAGPVAALIVWSLGEKAHDPATPAPAHRLQGGRDPAPVD